MKYKLEKIRLMEYFEIYLVFINIVGFAAMGIDKRRAKEHAWRIPEKSLFLISALGGSIGTWAGMYTFRHKTRHWYFVVGMPAILAVQVILFVLGYCVFIKRG